MASGHMGMQILKENPYHEKTCGQQESGTRYE